MLKKVGISLIAIMMLSSVALASDFPPVGDEKNKQESKQEERKVLQFDKEVVKKIMMKEFGYSDRDANDGVYFLGELDAKLQPVLDAYIADRTISDAFNVEGLTVKMIMNKYGGHFWAGLSYMDTCIKNPEKAKSMLSDLTPVRFHSLGDE